MASCPCSSNLWRLSSRSAPLALGRASRQQRRMPLASRQPLLQAPQRNRPMHARASGEPSSNGAPEDFEEDGGLLPEEDWVVPGGYQDTLSKNTKLGKAVDDACKELETLGQLEMESLSKANDLLRQLGYKGDITASTSQQEGASEPE